MHACLLPHQHLPLFEHFHCLYLLLLRSGGGCFACSLRLPLRLVNNMAALHLLLRRARGMAF